MRPTHSQPLVPFFQRRCPNFSSSVPKARAFLAFEISSLPSSVAGTTIRTVPSCIDLLPPLGVVLSYSSWDFFPLSHDPFLLLQHTSITIATFTSSLLFKSGSSLSLFFLPLILFVFLLSLTACRTFGSLHWCIYTLVHTYLRLVLPSLRPLRGLRSSCSRPAISTLLVILRHLSRRLETSTLLTVLKPPLFSPS